MAEAAGGSGVAGQATQMLLANGLRLAEWEQVGLRAFPQGHVYMNGFYRDGVIASLREDAVFEHYRVSLVARHGEEKTKQVLAVDRFNNLVWPTLSVNSRFQTLHNYYCFKLVTRFSNNRMIAFEGLKAFSTRLLNALEATDATAEKVKDAKTFNRKIQGKRAGEIAATTTDPNTPAPTNISASQQSYDQQIQHFAGLVSVLQSEASYAPNEVDLQIVTLTTKQADLVTKNNAVATAYTTVSNARIARDKTLYNNNTGLVDIAAEVKQYIKSIFGVSSPEYAQVKGIAFKTVKK